MVSPGGLTTCFGSCHRGSREGQRLRLHQSLCKFQGSVRSLTISFLTTINNIQVSPASSHVPMCVDTYILGQVGGTKDDLSALGADPIPISEPILSTWKSPEKRQDRLSFQQYQKPVGRRIHPVSPHQQQGETGCGPFTQRPQAKGVPVWARVTVWVWGDPTPVPSVTVSTSPS